MLALIIATPGIKIVRRLIYIIAGAILTFILHIISVLVMSVNAEGMRPLMVMFASIGIDLFPVVVWAVLSARYWWPRRGTAALSYNQ